MTGRERLLAVMNGQKPDRVPFAPMINDFTLSHLPKEERVEIDFLRKIKADVAARWVQSYNGFGINYDFTDKPSVIKTETKNGFDVITTYKTPIGSINQVKTTSPVAGETLFVTKHFVKCDSDIDIYSYIWECMTPGSDYERTEDTLSKIGEDGVGLLSLPSTPLLQLIMYDFGLEYLNFALLDYPEKMKSLLDVMTEKTLSAAKIAFDSPGEFFLIPENSGTRILTPAQFTDYCLPILQAFGNMARAQNKKVFLHACGHIQALMPLIAKANLHGIESLSEPPIGDATIEYARKILGEEAVIFSGLNPVEFAMLPPEQIARRVEETLKRVSDNPRFILMPSDSTPASVPMENYEIVIKTLEKYRS